ncbi:ImmA/IrrE family metallo-endopeptidase [Planococcus sp. X10-3]|uniref:ImmA/IrrE family metallo-endopeptidase n=1 Tax=Planococcus sp. X10-3 TaxID=3061240 RepID=UPI003BB20CE1
MKIPTRARYRLATQKAHEFIKENSINSLPVDPFVLADLMDVSLKTYTEVSIEKNQTLEETIKGFGSRDGIAALSDGVPGIFYNDTEIPSRVRFTIIHELGHIYLGHLDDFEETSFTRKNLSNEKYEVLERETNCFARNVLAPLPVVDSLEQINPKSLIELFFISSGAAKARLDFYALDIRNTQKALYTSTKSQFAPFIFKLHNTHGCVHCGSIHISINPKFCSICGNKDLSKIKKTIGVEVSMRYSEIYYNADKRPIACPSCNNEMLQNGPYCQVCSRYVINQCTGLYEDEINEYSSRIYWHSHQHGCEGTLSGDARFCSNCGSTSTYYEEGFLRSWNSDVQDPYIETVGATKNGLLVAVADEDLPF